MQVVAKFSLCKVVIVHMIYSNTDTLSLREKRSCAKLENTSLSTNVFPESAFGIYHVHNSETEKGILQAPGK